ncbi:MAG: tRNA (N(6)-L-threonylcarbamoyladenosine(37)-C(2))-methylthiotransferase MtaB [Lachnospiraceae bacterium]|nr:tRNA (N(6)-L-threonylcarbamoyladenosine(37)-C(2))-methylthiotransferase MtaB [Lachnospiraceae bacterium]
MKPQIRRVAFHNLGCKVNSYELDVIRQQFLHAGYIDVPFSEIADIYIINTCTVTNIADRKSRQMLHRARKENPGALVVAVGCYVETDPEKVRMDEAIDLAMDNRAKRHCLAHVEAFLREREQSASGPVQKIITENVTIDGPAAGNLSPRREEELTLPTRTRADIKIQDGCNQFCSYCIIPYARGRILSRDEDEILQEIRALAGRGTAEVVLAGIHVSSYGKDRGEAPEKALLRLLTKIQMLAGISRIRLSSLEPRIMTEEFVSGISRLSKLCPHFHLSLQSGCDKTLQEMNRHYTTAEYMESVERLRKYFDTPAITTDIITGFPGETEEDFAQTLAFANTVGFYEIHVFKYSRREGTPAAARKDQVPDDVKTKRSAALLALTERQAQAFRAQFIGREEEILAEETVTIDGSSFLSGHTKRYVRGLIKLRDGERAPRPGSLIRGIFEDPVEVEDALMFKTR